MARMSEFGMIREPWLFVVYPWYDGVSDETLLKTCIHMYMYIDTSHTLQRNKYTVELHIIEW